MPPRRFFLLNFNDLSAIADSLYEQSSFKFYRPILNLKI